MRSASLPLAWRYGLALLMALAGVLLRFVLAPIFGHDVPILISMIAVFAAAWYCGFGPGVAATAFGTLGGIYLFVSPWDGMNEVTLAQGIRLFLFFVTGCLISGLSEAVQRTTLAWHRAEQDKERMVLQERNRLAREIHDTLAQGLTGIIVQLQAMEDCLTDDPDAVRAHLHRAEELARQSLTEARRSVNALRPAKLEQHDFAETLSHYIGQITEGTGIKAHFTVEGNLPDSSLLPLNTRSELLRIGLEAVTNSVKHANPTHIYVILAFTASEVSLTIRDDGRGVRQASSATNGGFGLIAMQERAREIGAAFSWNNRPQSGTEVTVTVPLSTPSLLNTATLKN